MIRIYCTLKNRHTGEALPTLTLDPVEGMSRPAFTAIEGNGITVTFELPDDTPRWGFTVRWGRTLEQSAHSAVPIAVGDYDGEKLPLDPLPAVLDYGATAVIEGLRTEGDRFVTLSGQRWTWRGITDFRLGERVLGQGIAAIRPILQQRLDLGANLVRVLAMKMPNTNPVWTFDPRQANYWDAVRALFELTWEMGLWVEWTIFADTKAMMPDPAEQQPFFERTIALKREYAHVLPELLNEQGHSTQSINPAHFGPPEGVLASHGSGLTDADVVQPVWGYAAYHARRMAHPSDARGFTNYNPYAFQETWPKRCPYVPDEGVKPADYGYSVEYARQLGRAAGCGAGGTFHWSGGINSDLMNDQEAPCARAFFAELQ